MLNSIKGAAALSLALALTGAGVAAAQPAPAAAPAPRPAPVQGKPDVNLAPAGNYNLDSRHAGVVARVSHVGYSYSVFRFDDVKGTLVWDPANASANKVSVTVAPGSIVSNVPNFAKDINEKFLKVAQFPEAAFVSTSFVQTDPTHGKVAGNFTLMGKTRQETFDVSLIGAGPGFGAPRLGVHGRVWINPGDYGLDAAVTGKPIELVIDVEFVRSNK